MKRRKKLTASRCLTLQSGRGVDLEVSPYSFHLIFFFSFLFLSYALLPTYPAHISPFSRRDLELSPPCSHFLNYTIFLLNSRYSSIYYALFNASYLFYILNFTIFFFVQNVIWTCNSWFCFRLIRNCWLRCQ